MGFARVDGRLFMSYLKLFLIGAVWTMLPLPTAAHGSTPIKAMVPTKISIPAIRVTTNVDSVGLNRAKVMRPPFSATSVAWYNRGVLPGQPGSAVMYGHLTGSRFQPAVFANLRKLKKNDLIKVTDKRGNVFTYRVRRLAVFGADSLTYDHLAEASKSSHLNLYTCAGKWDARKRRYTHYQVVYTDLVSSVATR